MRYAYYPGCSLLSGAKEYDRSLRLVFAHLGIELVEIEDWSCCGAVHAEGAAVINLPGRNLALAEEQGFEAIIAPCSGCYRNLRRASQAFADDKTKRAALNEAFDGDLELKGDIEVLHPLYVLLYEYGLDKIKKQVQKPLSELSIASYYGCMLTRPKDKFDSTERPKGMDDLMRVLGAQVIDYPMKAKCCGGALAISHSDVTAQLSGKVLGSAKDAGAELVTLACPMCHTALDLYQGKASHAAQRALNLPVLYFTQVMGLALGIDPQKLGFKRHVVSPAAQLARLGVSL